MTGAADQGVTVIHRFRTFLMELHELEMGSVSRHARRYRSRNAPNHRSTGAAADILIRL